MTESVALLLAYVLDLIIGDPRWIPHPVQGIGRAIEKIESRLRKLISGYKRKTENSDTEEVQGPENEMPDFDHKTYLTDFIPSSFLRGKQMSPGDQEKLAGVLLVIAVVGITYVLFNVITSILFSITFHPVAEYITFGVYVCLLSTTMATRALLQSAIAVIKELNRGDIDTSRRKLSMIVGRDTASLQETKILRATIETLAENASDGIVAPLFYFAIGGLPLAMAYKAINTLDSMVGYKNDKYMNFGWASAKLDDIANYIPARITGILIVAAAYVLNKIRHVVYIGAQRFMNAEKGIGKLIGRMLNRLEKKMNKPDFESGPGAYKIMVRDGKKHSSPNSGFPEAAMAGALGVKIGGPSTYGGVMIKKPFIGDERQESDNMYLEAAVEAVMITKLTSLFILFIVILFV